MTLRLVRNGVALVLCGVALALLANTEPTDLLRILGIFGLELLAVAVSTLTDRHP